MTDYQAGLFVTGAVKASVILAGTLCVFMGYRLFVKGVFEGGAKLKLEGGSNNQESRGLKAVIAMDKGGPGLFFALFGAIIVVVGVFRATTVSTDRAVYGRAGDGSFEYTHNQAAPSSSGLEYQGQPQGASSSQRNEYTHNQATLGIPEKPNGAPRFQVRTGETP